MRKNNWKAVIFFIALISIYVSPARQFEGKKTLESIFDVSSSIEIIISYSASSDYLDIKGEYKSLNILDSNGRMVAENLGGEVIDVIGLPEGAYFLEYFDQEGIRRVSRFIKTQE